MARRHRKNKFGGNIYIPLLVVAALLLLYALKPSDTPTPAPTPLRGNFTAVATNPDADEQLIDYKGFTVSFNPQWHIPNWVSWELTRDELDGSVKRADKFTADPNIAASATDDDYRRSGYDRGHMCPAGDMKWDEQAMSSTFYLTNICPQHHRLNTGAWKALELKCRDRAVADSAIVIVCGPVMRKQPLGYIGKTKVAVPAEFFKVILSPYTNPPTAIGFIMPNSYVNGGMQPCAMSVDQIEAITGHDFFADLPDSIETIVEAQCNFPQWSTRKQ